MEIKHLETDTKGMFAAYEGSEKAGEMTYSKAGTDRIIIDHTQVDESQKGKGVGKKLVDAGVAFARSNNIKIVPLCPFARRVLTGSEEYRDVL